MIWKFVYYVGLVVRNRRILSHLRFLQKSQSWTLAQLEQHQTKKLKELLRYAYTNSRFYKNKLDKCGVSINSIDCLADLVRLPILEKDELRANADDHQIKDRGLGKLFVSETSGSSGKPLVFLRDEAWDAAHRASILRGYSWYDVKPWEYSGYFWGFNFGKFERLKVRFYDLLQNRFRAFSYSTDALTSFLSKLTKAKYLEGYSSMIYQVAKMVNNGKLEFSGDLKLIKGTSEKIFDNYSEATLKAFGKKIISEYGSAEAGIIAFECPHGNMHITMENVVIETLNDELLVTNLYSKSFPIIRYRLGDYVKMSSDSTCKCGMNHLIIADVMGRTGSVIYGKRNNYPSLTLYYVAKNLALQGITINYQGIQSEKGSLKFLVGRPLSSVELVLLNRELKRYFNEDLTIEVIHGTEISRGKGKAKDFISEVTLHHE